jgi:DNA-directed RNA polymerase beta subunit
MPSILNAFEAPPINSLARAPLAIPRVGAFPADSREFGDSAAVRQNIYDSIFDAATTLEPVSNAQHTLQLFDVHYADSPKFSIADQKHAILHRKNLSRRLRGTWKLVDNASGETLDEKKSTIANVPYFTNRGTIIRNGNEYTMSHQMRLKSGVFTRVKENGDLTAHVNIIPGKGFSHHIFLDPETGVFRIRFGNSNIALTSLLRAMGASDKELREAWGNDLSEINMRKSSPADIGKLYKKLVRYEEPDSGRSEQESVALAMAKMELNPDTTLRTLGKSFDHVSIESILTTTRKLLAISNSDNPAILKQLGLTPAKPDNRDSCCSFQAFLTSGLVASDC